MSVYSEYKPLIYTQRFILHDENMNSLKDTIIVFRGGSYIGWPITVHLIRMTNDDAAIFDNTPTGAHARTVSSDGHMPSTAVAEGLNAFRGHAVREIMASELSYVRGAERADDVLAKRGQGAESMKESIYPYARWRDPYIYNGRCFSLPRDVEGLLTVNDIMSLKGFG